MNSKLAYSKKINDIFETLKSSPQGITQVDAEKLLEAHGKNILDEGKKVTLFGIFFAQFKSPLIYVLLVSTIIVFLLKEVVDGIIIGSVILLNAIIGTVQEGKAQNTLRALTTVIKGKATVIRDGKTQIIEDSNVVPGDILLLKDGDVIPADARVFEVNELKINESTLTGESVPVVKEVKDLDEKVITPQEQVNMVFRGTYVLSGLGKAVVVATGQDTAIGNIASKLDLIESEIPLQQNIKNLSKVLIWIVLSFSVVIFVAGLLHGNEVKEMFKTVVALAVSAIPESLPVVVTLVLATGVWRMSKKNALVKKLQAVETLGQATVIALDKTGTITKNQMMVEKVWIDGEIFEVHGDGYNPAGYVSLRGDKVTPVTNKGLLYAGRVAAFTAIAETLYDVEKEEWKSIMGDPTEAALKVFAEKIGMPKDELLKQYPQNFEIPFSFETKHHTTINTINNEDFLSIAGSAEVLLSLATTLWSGGSAKEISDEDRKAIKKEMNEYSSQGYRLLGLGFNEKPHTKKIKNEKDVSGITFLGFVAITDVIRSDVNEAVSAAREAGMKVVMITGDNVLTAQSIGERVGIYREGDLLLEGNKIEEMSDLELDGTLRGVTIFARVSPEHKLRIIESYKRIGEIVAMTGDGINDALSLVAADLGVAMGKVGTEVAREASDIILLDDNFDNIRVAVEEGRSIYLTIRKSILYLLSTNVGELLVIFIAVLFGWKMPLLASQIIWLNMVTDTFLVAALAVDPKEEGLLQRRMKKPGKYLVDKLMLIRIILIGGVMTALTLGFFYYYTVVLNAPMVKVWSITLTVLTVIQWYNVWNVRSETRSIFRMNPFNNKWLIVGTFFAVGLHLIALYNPFMQNILKTTGLTIYEWIAILIASLVVILVEEIRKHFARRKVT